MNSSVHPALIIVFTRYPEPGAVKTRLIPALGPEGACRFHRKSTERTMEQVRLLQESRPVAVEIHFAGGNPSAMLDWLGEEWEYVTQTDGDLGRRMDQAFSQAFEHGRKQVLLIGTDCPELKDRHLRDALVRLEVNDLVLGPARDGGYYLIGLKGPQPGLFHPALPWGTSRVLPETLRAADHEGLRVSLLETLSDIDRPEDLSILDPEERPSRSPAAPEISIIIPTLNEGPSIGRTLSAIDRNSAPEIIVADGGSSDDTCARAEICGAKVVHAPPGRARQMNRGAAEALGNLLLFLHADTILPPDFAAQIRTTLARPGVIAGAFRLKIASDLKGLRVIEGLANFRSARGQLPYGDQGLFLTADLFREMGGYPDVSFMEDVGLIRRLRRRGKIAIAPAAVVTSARRWEKVGVWRNTWINQLLLAGYYLGFKPERLSKYYRSPIASKNQPLEEG